MSASEVGAGPVTRIEIDTDVCIGAGQCVLAAPTVFTQDDDGFSAVLEGMEDGGGSAMVGVAVRACPVGAISLGPKTP